MLKEEPMELDMDLNDQRCFRVLLKAMSHPGRAYPLAAETMEFHQDPLVAISRSLLDHEVGFHFLNETEHTSLERTIFETTKAQRQSLQSADYIMVVGSDSNGAVKYAKRGDMAYPDQGATIIYAVDDFLETDTSSHIMLSGPGINPNQPHRPQINALSLDEWRCLQLINRDYPRGIDCIVVTSQKDVMCIPRSTRIRVMREV